jgi:CDP-paratose 2-epimerase
VRKYGWRPGDQRYYVSDIRQARRALGWSPRVGVDQGLQRLYEWMQHQSQRLAAAV